MTKTLNPLLCHCSATLALDATRIIIRDDDPLNQSVLTDLATLYCSQYLQTLNPYGMNNWPLHSTSPQSTMMQLLVDNVLTMLGQSSENTFPVLLGAEERTLGPLKSLCFAPVEVEGRPQIQRHRTEGPPDPRHESSSLLHAVSGQTAATAAAAVKPSAMRQTRQMRSRGTCFLMRRWRC